jgi:hypothetical protein
MCWVSRWGVEDSYFGDFATPKRPLAFFHETNAFEGVELMKTKLLVAAAFAGGMLATFLAPGSAQATSVPVLKSDANAGIVTLVGKKGGGGGGHARGGGGGGKHARGGGGGGGKHARGGGGGGGGGGKRHSGGDGGKRHYDDDRRHYAYKRHDHDDHDGRYRRYYRYGSYGLPYISYGYGGGCGWLYTNAVATDDPYWWNRYYECIGYY